MTDENILSRSKSFSPTENFMAYECLTAGAWDSFGRSIYVIKDIPTIYCLLSMYPRAHDVSTQLLLVFLAW